MTAGLAWYRSERPAFLAAGLEEVIGTLANAATKGGLHIEAEQNEEWRRSIGLLQVQLQDRLAAIRSALAAPELAAYQNVVLEYDFRRRGLRLDCVLLGDGIIAVIEFKRSEVTAADRDQVTNYCINLLEFHEETRPVCNQDDCIIVPVVCLTEGLCPASDQIPSKFHNSPWTSVVRKPLECDRRSLGTALRAALGARRGSIPIIGDTWSSAKFSPSSTILDAAISLYGDHDVSAIARHAASIENIVECTEEVAQVIERSRRDRRNRVVFVSGAPGAGKTLVGLKLAFDARFRNDAVFVTGNAPLVDVLTEALKGSYLSGTKRRASLVTSGYSMRDAPQVARMATFKIVKAHNFLGERGNSTSSTDGRVLIFDEAQRTYAKGREVLRKRLEANEAELILRSLGRSFPDGGIVVVALIGHNQAINRGELGATAWCDAAKQCGWSYVIGSKTLELVGETWTCREDATKNRESLRTGHLPHSLRYYRNSSIEQWAAAVLNDNSREAASIAAKLEDSDAIWITRDLATARAWARHQRVGEERAGVVASGQARRLAAEGLFVELKPDIAKWMLAPTGDIRSSNTLETVQNQFQIQGLEIDYAIVCWDIDLRRGSDSWKAFKISGSKWQSDGGLEVAKNSYRVLLTRARKGMALFVPIGDKSGEDATRECSLYNGIAEYLKACGAKSLVI